MALYDYHYQRPRLDQRQERTDELEEEAGSGSYAIWRRELATTLLLAALLVVALLTVESPDGPRLAEASARRTRPAEAAESPVDGVSGI